MKSQSDANGGGPVCLDTSKSTSPSPVSTLKVRSKKADAASPTAVILSKCLIGIIVSLIYLWHCITPFIVQPSPEIIPDLLKSGLIRAAEGMTSPSSGESITIENWTKWRLYVNSSVLLQHTIEAMTKDNVPFSTSAVVFAQWRPYHEIHLRAAEIGEDQAGPLRYQQVTPPFSFDSYGIFDHLRVIIDHDKGQGSTVVKMMPRFLFGLSTDTIRSLYGDENGNVQERLPIVGIFGRTTMYDRIVIQIAMFFIILSVIFLLVTNHPPSTMLPRSQKKMNNNKATVIPTSPSAEKSNGQADVKKSQ